MGVEASGTGGVLGRRCWRRLERQAHRKPRHLRMDSVEPEVQYCSIGRVDVPPGSAGSPAQKSGTLRVVLCRGQQPRTTDYEYLAT
jgi:hypothetical protein